MEKPKNTTPTTRTPTRQMRFRARVSVVLVAVVWLANTSK